MATSQLDARLRESYQGGPPWPQKIPGGSDRCLAGRGERSPGEVCGKNRVDRFASLRSRSGTRLTESHAVTEPGPGEAIPGAAWLDCQFCAQDRSIAKRSVENGAHLLSANDMRLVAADLDALGAPAGVTIDDGNRIEPTPDRASRVEVERGP